MILELLENYELNTLAIAIIVCILTGIIKMPIKFFAEKSKNGKAFTRFIVFLPIIVGFGVTFLYEFILTKSVVISNELIKLWVASSSASLAIYAFIEKFIPGKKRILTEYERNKNEEILEKVKNYIDEHDKVDTECLDLNTSDKVVENQSDNESVEKNDSVKHDDKNLCNGKIILRGRINDEAEKE